MDTAVTSALLVKRQRSFDADAGSGGCCSTRHCFERPEYDYSFELYSTAHGGWHVRHYFYCPRHMTIVAQGKSLAIPKCLPVTYQGNHRLPTGSSGIQCVFCGKPKARLSTTRNALYTVVCGLCGAHGPKEDDPAEAARP